MIAFDAQICTLSRLSYFGFEIEFSLSKYVQKEWLFRRFAARKTVSKKDRCLFMRFGYTDN